MSTGPFQSMVACFLGACSFACAISPSAAAAAALRPAAARVHASATHVSRSSARHRQTPVEAYIFVPGLGTVVVSVKANGRTTIAPVPAHLNESNFSVDSHSIELRTARFESAARGAFRPSTYAKQRLAV